MAARFDFARRMARKYLRRHRVAEPPVPVEYILFQENVRVEVLDYPDETAGESWWDEGVPSGRACIAVNRSLPRPRLRFTLAHEWGHLALRHHGHPVFDLSFLSSPGRLRDREESWEPAEPIEVEANTFAGELLMPGYLFLPDWERRPDARALAARYEVSYAAVCWRVRSLRPGRRAD